MKRNRPYVFACIIFIAAMIKAEGEASLQSGTTQIPNYSVRIQPAVTPVPLNPGPHLFIDDYLIAYSGNLTKTTHAPKRVLNEPIMGWQQGTWQPYLTVLRDPETQKFRMWYNRGIGRECAIAYAESEDGIKWSTPNLGILGDDNRLFMISYPHQNGYGISVIDEGTSFADKERRFKAAWWGQSKPWTEESPNGGGDPGMRVAFSPDGIHWSQYEGNPVLPDFGEKWFVDDPRRPYGVGDIIDVYWDSMRGRYGALLKTPAVTSDGYSTGPRARHYIRRLVSASASDDFMHWRQPWRIIVPETRDAGQLEFYGIGGTIARGGLLIGFVRMLHDDYAAEPDGPKDGIGYTTLATSRDGVHWERQDDIFFDRNSESDTWDRAMTWVGSALPVGDELYLYYGGYKRGHKIAPETERQLGLAKMPMDRFVSRDATGSVQGILITAPLRPSKSEAYKLVLNANASSGQIRLRLCDALSREVLPGYGFEDCEPISGDGLALPVVWQKNSNLPTAAFRIEFEVTQASLFGFDTRPANQDSKPINVGDRKQLFIDEKFLDESCQVQIVMNRPVKEGVVLECDRPWEDFRLTSYFTVVQDGDLCRMYYSCFSKDQWHTPDSWDKHAYLCYAESHDGINWEKPDLGIVEFEGSRKNNIIMRSVVDGTVFIDPNAPPERRYKLLSTVGPHKGGLRVSYSPDGVHFTMPEQPVVNWNPDSQQNAFWDRNLGKYVAYLRGRPEMGIQPKNRLVMRVELGDIEKKWDAKPEIVLQTDAVDPQNVDFYTNACVCYSWADDAYFMFPALYKHFLPEMGNDGLLDTSLAISRDGIHWQRPDRSPYISMGLTDEWDANFLMMGVGMVRQGNRIYQYYNGVDLTHGGTRGMTDEERAQWRRWGKIGRVVQRLDGFCSADADYNAGWLITPPIIFKGSRLRLNLNTSAAGSVKVAILDLEKRSFPGYSFDDCDEVMTNDVAHEMTWRGNPDISQLEGQPVRLFFLMNSTKLYAFQFQHAD